MKHPPYPVDRRRPVAGLLPVRRCRASAPRARAVGRVGRSLALDGAIAATGAAAISAALLGPSLVGYRNAADPIELAVNPAYPVGDMFLLGGIAAAAVLVGWRRDFMLSASA